MTTPDSAEEFYAQRLDNAATLEQAARRRALHADAIRALALAHGCDVELTQAFLWEQSVVVPGATPRQFFEAAVILAPHAASAPTIPSRDCADLMARARRDLTARLDPDTAAALNERLPDIGYLVGLPVPSAEDLDIAVLQRLEGSGPADFAAQRRAQSRAAMEQAQRLRVQGDVAEAIRTAYSADFAALEAYLVTSAIAAGDGALFTVTTRWELASRAVARLEALPADFVGAVSAVRTAMCQPLGDADGQRLTEAFTGL